MGNLNSRLLGVGAVEISGTRYGRIIMEVTPEGTFMTSHFDNYGVGGSDSSAYGFFNTSFKNTTSASSIKFTAGTNYGSSGGFFGVGTEFIVIAQ